MFYHHLWNELWKLFGKKRTYIGFGAFLIGQNAMLVAFRYSHWQERMRGLLEGNGYIAQEYVSALTVAVIMLIPQILLLMPLYVALVGGDLVAKEVEDGTLRMILCRPISRLRLLLLKWMAGVVFSLTLVLSLGLFGALFASAFFPAGGLFVALPLERFMSGFDGAQAWVRFATVHLFMTVEAVTLMTLAFMFSCFNVKPAAATILAISVFFISMILHDMPYFRDLREWFMVHHLYLWSLIFRQHIPWWRVGESLSILAGYNLTFLVVGCAYFQVRDIKS